MAERVAVLGLGTMGGRAAAAIAAGGFETSGHDPSGDARERAAAQGVRVAESAEDALAGAGVVLLSVPRPEDVRALVGGPLSFLAEGSVVVDTSTIDPDTARGAAADLATRGVAYLDAPVLGRPAGCGSWTLVAGGDPDAVARVRPLLEATVARQVLAIGEPGTGSLVKLMNNLMFGAINAVTAEALGVCRAAGVDMATFVDAVTSSGAATVSNLFADIGPRIAAGDDDPVFALDLLVKDNNLARAVAEGLGVDAPIARTVCILNEAAAAAGYGDRDTSAVAHLYEGS